MSGEFLDNQVHGALRIHVFTIATAIATLSGCGPGSGVIASDNDGGSSTNAAATEALGMTSSTGAAFDIGPWVGRHHYEPPFQPFGLVNDIHGSAVLGNFEIRPDFTAVASWDDCFTASEDVHEASYLIEPISTDRVRLVSAEGEPTLGYWASELPGIELTLDPECGVVTFELTREPNEQPVSDDFWHPGAACWVSRCATVGEDGWTTTFQIDYCEGEQPPTCP